MLTGGHRRLGAAIAGALARRGYALALHGSRDAEPEPDLARLIDDRGVDHALFTRDFTDPAGAGDLVAAVTARFGRAPDLLVNNASLFEEDGIGTVTAEALMTHYAVNCAAPALLIQAFAAAAREPETRAIVNILDQRIVRPHPDQLGYTLSKCALAALTTIAARALPGISVNAVAPGLTLATPDYGAAQMAGIAARMPLARLSTPGDIAQAVAFLAGARGITGQTIFVDGGAHLVQFDRDFVYLDA